MHTLPVRPHCSGTAAWGRETAVNELNGNIIVTIVSVYNFHRIVVCHARYVAALSINIRR